MEHNKFIWKPSQGVEPKAVLQLNIIYAESHLEHDRDLAFYPQGLLQEATGGFEADF